MRALVVEDNAITGEALADWFRRAGHEAAWSADGRAALDRLSSFAADVVVLDLLMPGMGGREFLARLPPGGPPVVVLTAAPDADVAGLPAGLVLLRKPVSPDEVVRAAEGAARAALAGEEAGG